MKIDIGIASYRNPAKLKATIESIKAMSQSDWRLLIVHNPGEDDQATVAVINEATTEDKRIEAKLNYVNMGYAGAVNAIAEWAESEFFIYCDNDISVETPGWDLKLCEPFQHPEVAQVFPGCGHYHMNNGIYDECLWNAGYCWAMRKDAIAVDYRKPMWGREGPTWPGGGWPMDVSLGHHEEVDLMIRLRMAGYQIACRPDVEVIHHETSTRSKESEKRIHRGVVNWMAKWNRYFLGDAIKYPNPDPDSGEGYDPRALRYTDWPPCALYLERFTLANFPDWNRNPRKVNVSGVGVMDAVEILKPADCYRGRAI